MEDEKKELAESMQSLYNDYENLGVSIEFLDKQISGDTSHEKLKKLIEDVELWVSEINNCISRLDEARVIFRKKQIINRL